MHNLIIATHGDDELLWFQPLLGPGTGIMWAGPAMGATRKSRLLEIYPSSTLMELFPTISDQQWVDEALAPCARDITTYPIAVIKAALRPVLCRAKRRWGLERVFTHNPWGEYGHPNHRALSQAVREVCADIGLDVWANAVVHTHLTNNLSSNPPGVYLDAAFLSAPYLSGYAFDEAAFLAARAMFMDTYTHATVNGAPWQDDLWTWHAQSTQEYPTGPRAYWQMVSGNTDLILANATLADQVAKIAGGTPYPNGDPHAAYLSPLYYYCATSGSAPVYGPP